MLNAPTQFATAQDTSFLSPTSYLNYIDGADIEAIPFVELTCSLVPYFGGNYSHEQLAQALLELNPEVVFVATVEPDGSLRSDLPTLAGYALIDLQDTLNQLAATASNRQPLAAFSGRCATALV